MHPPGAPDQRFASALKEPRLPAKARALAAWWATTRPARALARYLGVNGPLLSSGMALTGLLALTAALTLLATLLIGVMGGDDALLLAVEGRLADIVPSLIVTPEEPDGLIDLRVLVLSNALSLTGAISVAVMAGTAIGVVGQLGYSIRAIFGKRRPTGAWHLQLARNILGALGLVVTLIAGTVIGIGADLANDALLGVLGIASSPASRVLVQIGSAVLSFVAAGVAAWILIELVAGVRVPWKELGAGLALFSLVSLGLRIAGTSIIGAVDDPLLATAAALVVIVAWLTLQVRVLLLACAWMANPPAPAPTLPSRPFVHGARPNYETLS